jgi:signal recognition particle subunit SRP54
MFDSLQTSLRSAFKTLTGKGRLTESNMREGLKLVEKSLLEADVSISVIRDFMDSVTTKALGEKVLLSLKPHEQLVAIVHQELINLLGPVDNSIQLREGTTTVIMMCGLQGSGKTTTCGKLAKLLLHEKVRPMLVAADLQRPAAIQQLRVLGESLGVPVYWEEGQQDPVKVCRDAVAKATAEGYKIVILDTAGRLAIDQELMQQLRDIDKQVQPHHVFLVVDGMTGQDAVNSAAAFHEALELDGVILTKLDGDARGGALLSVKHVTGVPIKFIGTGENMDALEPFNPDGMAGRILGLGDIVGLAREAQMLMDQEEQEKLRRQMEKGQMTLEDFRNHIQKIAKPGLLQKMVMMMPGIPAEARDMLKQITGSAEGAKAIKRQVGMIDSMTQEERRNPKIIDSTRRQRIARGSGAAPNEISELIKQFDSMKGMMQMMAGGDPMDRQAAMQKMQEQMLNPNAQMPKNKGTTGKRLTPKEREKQRKERERKLKQKQKEEQDRKKGQM